jgi:hypothetical protein
MTRETPDWVWNARFTHWWFKKDRETRDVEHHFNSAFTGIADDKEIARVIGRLKKAHINAVLTHGIVRLVKLNELGLAPKVIAGTKHVVEACHAADIRVLHHCSAGLAEQTLREVRQKEWLTVDIRTGTYGRLDQWGGWYWYCVNNPGYRRHYFNLATEFLQGSGVDGFMVDEVYFRTGWGTCACPHCRRKFKRRTGYALPGRNDSTFWDNMDDPRFREWLRFRCESVGDFYEDLATALKRIDPHQVLLGCKNKEENQRHSQQYGDHNDERMRGVNLLFYETENPSTILYNWQSRAVSLRLYSALGHAYNTPTMTFMRNTNANEDFFSWALRAAHGMRIWAASRGTMLGVPTHVFRSAESQALHEEIFGWEAEHESELIRSVLPFSNVAVLFSASTRDMYKGSHADYYVEEWFGWCRVLLDANIQYEIIVERDLDNSGLEQYDHLILPNAACLSDRQCEVIRAFVGRGGNLIMTHETSLLDETGERRADFALADLIGANYRRTVEGTHLPVVFGGFPARGIRNGERGKCSTEFYPCSQVLTCPGPGVTTVGTTIVDECTESVVVCSRQGKSRLVYLGNKPGLMYYIPQRIPGVRPIRAFTCEEDRARYKRLMLDAIGWAMRGKFNLLTEDVPEGVMVKAFRQRHDGRDAVVIHLLNCLGATCGPNNVIPDQHKVTYPRIKRDMAIVLRGHKVKDACIISPDWKGKRDVAFNKVQGGCRITIPANSLRRYSVVYVT